MTDKEKAPKKDVVKPEKSSEPVITDIQEEFFFEGDVEKIRRRHFSGDKLVKEEVVNS